MLLIYIFYKKKYRTELVDSSLNSINYSRAKALAIVINSPGGYIQQADFISHKILHHARHHKLPLYTFAEDYALSAAYYILSVGDKIFVDSSSSIGMIGMISSYYTYGNILKKYGVEPRKFQSNTYLKIKKKGKLFCLGNCSRI